MAKLGYRNPPPLTPDKKAPPTGGAFFISD